MERKDVRKPKPSRQDMGETWFLTAKDANKREREMGSADFPGNLRYRRGASSGLGDAGQDCPNGWGF